MQASCPRFDLEKLVALRLLAKAIYFTQRMLLVKGFHRTMVMQIAINKLEPSLNSTSARHNDLLIFLKDLNVLLAQSFFRPE